MATVGTVVISAPLTLLSPSAWKSCVAGLSHLDWRRMNVLELTVLIWLGAFMAGFRGSLTGLGGGVVLVPLLALVFKVDLRYAIGAPLGSVIATSSGPAAAYVDDGFSNMRIALCLDNAS